MNYFLKALFYICCFSLTILSCSEDLSIDEGTTTITPRPDVKVNATITGLILDEAENPLEDAEITIENQSVSSDVNGYFSLSGLYNQGGTLVSVSKIGYFDAHGTVMPTEDGVVQVRFVMSGQVNPSGGSAQSDLKVESENFSISFQADGFTLGASDLIGNVNIYSRYIDPSSALGRRQLPGSIIARAEGIKKLVTPFAILDAELFSDENEQVQLSKNATISLNIPPDLWSEAPPEVSLFYLDTNDGYWKEEGKAVRIGNSYEGEVSHFTSWCAGTPNDFIIVSGQIKRDGQPYAFVKHRIYGSHGYYTADHQGNYVRLAIKDKAFSMKILDACLSVIHEEQVMASSQDITVDVDFSASGNSLELSGQLLDCDSNPTNDGYVLIKFAQNNYFDLFPVDASGMYSIFYETCSSGDIKIKGYDFVNEITSEPIDVSTSGIYDLNLCESLGAYQLTISIEGEEPYVINNCVVSVTDNSSGVLIGNKYVFTVIDAFPDDPEAVGESVAYQWGVTIFENEGVPGLVDLNPLPIKTDNPPILWLLQFDTGDLTIQSETSDMVTLVAGVTEEFSAKIVNGVSEELDGKTATMTFVAEKQ